MILKIILEIFCRRPLDMERSWLRPCTVWRLTQHGTILATPLCSMATYSVHKSIYNMHALFCYLFLNNYVKTLVPVMPNIYLTNQYKFPKNVRL